jgi:endonuclease YncB( thermonuclease family)
MHKYCLYVLAVWLCFFAKASAGILPTGPEWKELTGCEIISHHNNDGDSFLVRWQDQEFVIRIYFVDAPESNLRYRDRVQAQADYFGISLHEAVEVGHMATAYVEELLKDGFTVYTRWQSVFSTYQTTRKYGIVVVEGRDLAELLVEQGLGRVHGQRVKGMTAPVNARLQELEGIAKQEGRGAWAMIPNRTQD